MSTTADERAKGVDLPEWWLMKVRELVDVRKEELGESGTMLGRALATAVGREEAWDHSSVSRFLRNKNTTVPMAEAFSALLGIPRPFYFPRSLDEALALTATAKRYDAKDAKVTTSEQSRRLAEVDALLDHETRTARVDHSGRGTDDEQLHGKDVVGGGRGRRATRRRPPPARS